jgi:hypothetical protein
MMREFLLRDRLLAPLMRQLRADQADLRANLVASQLVGLGIARYVLAVEPLASAKARESRRTGLTCLITVGKFLSALGTLNPLELT